MKIERKGPDGRVVEIEGKVRIEPGPLRQRAVATKQLIADEVTARHYRVGEPDALGKTIKLGNEIDYIHWRNAAEVFYVYLLDAKTGRFLPQGQRDTYEEALSVATELAA